MTHKFDEIWELPREAVLALLVLHAAQIEHMQLDDDQLDRELGELDFLIHTTRNRIFHDARGRNRLSTPPRKYQPARQTKTIDDLLF